ncbi:VWA domain-containing protein [Nocardia shimofusensis]|uniref:VWA domain-containing protein n=1 Tax=Nocardia shimofusensis TaxID=228596 RepID=UPI0012ECD328|nr:VWA domain-containing protein [Nocardia shimofusensis]
MLTALCAAAVLTACTGTSEDPETGPPPLQPGQVPALVPVAYPDAPRELDTTEKLMMYEPGPYAGEAFDQEAVLDRVRVMAPESAKEWQQAILSQIHGDYAEAVRGTIEFDASVGEIAPGPEDEVSGEQEAVGTNHFALVLDASGSMAETSESGTRLDEAKHALANFVDDLPDNATVSLRVYGHRGADDEAGKAESCAATEVVYSDKADSARFAAALAPIQPVGWTPLASSITAVATDIPANATDSIAYIVTDGLETCDGDPVRAAEELAVTGVRPIVNVIGFHVGDADRTALEAIARAGNGTYTAASDAGALDDHLEAEYRRLMDAWSRWQRAELDRISAEGRENMDEATALGRTIMDTAVQERGHAATVFDALHEAGDVDRETKDALWSFFYDRESTLWSYGYTTQTFNWGNAYAEQTTNWSEVYATGTSRWSEYYSKSLN